MSKILQKIEENERELDKKFVKMLQCLYGGDNAEIEAKVIIKAFFYDKQISLLEEVKKEIESLVVAECNIARSKGEKTSRLTSLAMKVKDL